jgi:Sec-independent protein translocase protein TatA
MSRFLLVLALSLSLVTGLTFSVLADEVTDNQEVQQVADEINEEAESDSGKAAVVERLKNEFDVEESVINDLRSKQMGYGEVGIALSLAKQMPGGITEENIQKVIDLRQGETKTGWGNVAKQLDLNLGKTVSQTKKMSQEVKKTNTEQINAKTNAQLKTQKPPSSGKPSTPKVSIPQRPAGAKGKK